MNICQAVPSQAVVNTSLENAQDVVAYKRQRRIRCAYHYLRVNTRTFILVIYSRFNVTVGVEM